jgi:hypothetical protein
MTTKKRPNENYSTYKLYIECEDLQTYYPLSDQEWILTEWVYNLTSKATRMLEKGIDVGVTYNALRKNLLEWCDIAIPNLTSVQKAQKKAALEPIFASLVKKGVLVKGPDYLYRGERGFTEYRWMYEFTDEAKDVLKNPHIYIEMPTLEPANNITIDPLF